MSQNSSNEKKKNEKKRARGSSSTDGGEDVDSRILEKLSSIQDRIETGLTKMDADFAALKSELQHEIRVVKKELSEVSTSLETAWVEVETLKEKKTLLEGQLQHTLQKNSKLSEEVRLLKDRAIRQEDYSRRENLRFYNIPDNPEETNEECFAYVYIDKDLSAESAKERGKLRAAYRKAKEANIERVFIKGNKLFVNSSSYSVDALPQYLLPENNGKP